MANRSNAKLLARVRRLKGEVEAVERALEADVELPDCRAPDLVRGARPDPRGPAQRLGQD